MWVLRSFHFITVHPTFVRAYFEFGALRRLSSQGNAEFEAIDLRDFATDGRGSVDDRPYGGGDGMVLRPEPLAAALSACPKDSHVILTDPRGTVFRHEHARALANDPRPQVWVCGRFSGVDERFIEHHVETLYSLGPFVMSGGELAALAMVDAAVRWIPGSLGHPRSAAEDSFSEDLGGRLEHPLYTRPEVYQGSAVPEVLLSGDHRAIADWRRRSQREY